MIFKADISTVLHTLWNFANSYSTEVFVVGGFVRDIVMGKQPKDIDVVVTTDHRETAEKFANYLGDACVGFHVDSKTAKVVMATSSGNLEIDITGMAGRSIGDDLHRRDFTMNAMAMSLESLISGSLATIDPFGATADIRNGVIRLTDEKVLRDDPVRCIRGVRQSVQHGLEMTPSTALAIQDHADLITTVAGERVGAEVMLMMDTPEATLGIELMDDLGLLDAVIPELTNGKGVTQPPDVHAHDVFRHGVETLRHMESFIAGSRDDILQPEDGLFDNLVGCYSTGQVMKLTALLHDVGKPKTWDDSSGRIRFLGHEDSGADLIDTITRRLRFSNDVRDTMVNLVQNHMHPHHLAGGGRTPSPKAIRKYYRRAGTDAHALLFLGMADYLGGRGHLLDTDLWQSYVEGIHKIAAGVEEQQQRVEIPLVTGRDVLNLGIKEGPEVGRILSRVHEAQSLGEFSTREEGLELLMEFVN